MTEQQSNLPAIRQTREVARQDTDSWTTVFGEVLELARGIADTEFVPSSLRGSIPATTAAILYGREVGLPPMAALNSTHVIDGRPSLEAQAMRAMVLAAGHEIEVTDSTGAVCKMRARRNGSERWTPEVVWTIDAARAAGLTGKKNWEKYPRRMLQARATSELCELYFPDVIMGFRSIEEMLDSTDENEPRAVETTPVQRTTRKRAAAKKATPPAPAATRPAAPEGPPLPGDDGYEGDTPAAGTTSTGAVGDAAPVDPDPSSPTTAVPAAVEGSDSDSGSTVAPDEDRGSSVGEEADVVDAELVDEETPGEGQDGTPDSGPSSPGPRFANRAQVRALNTILTRSFDVWDDDRHPVVSALLGRQVTSLNDVTADEISTLMDTLKMLDGREALDALVLASQQRAAVNEERES